MDWLSSISLEEFLEERGELSLHLEKPRVTAAEFVIRSLDLVTFAQIKIFNFGNRYDSQLPAGGENARSQSLQPPSTPALHRLPSSATQQRDKWSGIMISCLAQTKPIAALRQ